MTDKELVKECQKWIDIAEQRKNRLKDIAQFTLNSIYSDKEILYFIRQVALERKDNCPTQ